MRQTRNHHSWLFCFFICGLIILLTACSSQSTPGGNSGGTGNAATATQSASPGAQATSSAQPAPQTSTNCPATNSGRAAVLSPLTHGQDQNLLYVYKDSSSTWHLRRYDARTGQKTDIYTTAAGQIEDAQVSEDGQWVVFLIDFYPAMRTAASAEIQMIRLDGQALQTLYCFSISEAYSHFGGGSGTGPSLPIGLQLSPDQKSLLFSVDTNNQQSTIDDLNMANGQIQQVYQAADSNFSTSIVTWLDNSDAYLITQGRTQPAPPSTVRLLNLSNKAATQVFQGGGHMNDLSLDTSFDGTKLYTDDCLLAGDPYQSTIAVESSHGGASQTIYQPPAALCVYALRVISSTTILMLVSDRNVSTDVIQTVIMTMNVNGSAQHELASPAPFSSMFSLNPNSQYTWSNISRDGSMYALQEEADNSIEKLAIGSVNGGDITRFASSTANTLTLVGWTTM